MKWYLSGLMMLVVAIGFTSCQKEVEGRLDEEEELLNDSIYIKKAISLDTTQPVGVDTGFVSEYFYDSQKRVIKLSEAEYDLAGVQYPRVSFFNYSGSDTVPFRKKTIYGNPFDSTVTYYFYSNGLVIRDSTTNFSSGIIQFISNRYYNNAGSGLYTTSDYRAYPPALGTFFLSDSVTYKRNFTAGNLISGVDSTWTSGVLHQTRTFQTTFDMKVNPFKRFGFFNNGYYSSDLVDADLWGKNNGISFSYEEDPPFLPGGQTLFNFNIVYTYRNDGYPVVGKISGDSDFNKIIYLYTN